MITQHGQIVGCYTLDLYCAIDHYGLGQSFYKTDYNQFTGRTESASIRAARKSGWVVTRYQVLCPQHTAQKHKRVK